MKISTHIAILLTLVMTQNAGAIQVAEEQGKTAASPSQTASSEREGFIGKIGLGGNTMVVDGRSYSFSLATTSVHGTRLLALRKNDRIRFKTLTQSGTEQIVEIWLISAAQH